MSSRVEQLCEQATRGDAAAIDQLLVRYQPRLAAYLRLRAGNLLARESVSDLAQSVCRDVLENLDHFRFGGEENFRRWLYATATRKLADRRAFWSAKRRDAARDAHPGAADEPTGLEAFLSLGTPSRVAIAREELARVQAAIDSLPDDQREVVLLSRVLGLSRADVAEVMDRSEGSVRMLLCRGLAAVASAAVAER